MTEFQCLNIVITDWQQIDTPNYDNKLQSNTPTVSDPKYPSPGSNPVNISDPHLHKPSQLLSQVWFSHLVPWFTSGHLAYDTTNLSFCQDPPCLPQPTHIFLHHIQPVPAYSYPEFSTVRIPDLPVHTLTQTPRSTPILQAWKRMHILYMHHLSPCYAAGFIALYWPTSTFKSNSVLHTFLWPNWLCA